MEYTLVPGPGSKIKLSDFDPDFHADISKDDARDETRALQDQLQGLQERLYAENRQALLVILQAMDTGGKDGVIRNVFDGVNPQGVRVASFKAPTPEELAHDFLWRVHQQVPPRGHIGIFNRSHYEDVLVVRVNQLVPEAVWKKRYEQINHFEKLLHDNGTRILKFYLHISKAEQKQRLEERLADPSKHWKFSVADLPVRERWGDYMQAYEDVLERCSTDHAPWYIVPANHKWYRDLVICRAIVAALQDMNPQYPESDADLSKVKIPD